MQIDSDIDSVSVKSHYITVCCNAKPVQTAVGIVKIANDGYAKALSEDKHLLAGLNVCKGQVTYKAVADVFGHDYIDPLSTL